MNPIYTTLSLHFWWRYVLAEAALIVLSATMTMVLGEAISGGIRKLLVLASIFLVPYFMFSWVLKYAPNRIALTYTGTSRHGKLAFACYWRFILMTVLIMATLAGALKGTWLGQYLAPTRLALSFPIAYLSLAWACSWAKRKGQITLSN